jgi:hypothetical protein
MSDCGIPCGGPPQGSTSRQTCAGTVLEFRAAVTSYSRSSGPSPSGKSLDGCDWLSLAVEGSEGVSDSNPVGDVRSAPNMRVRVFVREQGARGAQAAQLEWPSRRNSCRMRRGEIVHWSSNLAPGTRTTGLA